MQTTATPNSWIPSPKARGYIYKIAAAAGPILVFYGIATAEEFALWLGFAGTLLGSSALVLADVNKPKEIPLAEQAAALEAEADSLESAYNAGRKEVLEEIIETPQQPVSELELISLANEQLSAGYEEKATIGGETLSEAYKLVDEGPALADHVAKLPAGVDPEKLIQAADRQLEAPALPTTRREAKEAQEQIAQAEGRLPAFRLED